MERRVTSHTEEEEMNQRRRLLTLARKGDQKSIELLFELYQVKVFSGDALKKKKLPSFPIPKASNGSGKTGGKGAKNKEKVAKVSIVDAKARKVQADKAQSTAKGPSKIKVKTGTAKSSSTKSTKPILPKKSGKKKAISPKKKSTGKLSKSPKPSAGKKPRIAKKK